MYCPFNYTYTIQKGDTLYGISKYYHTTVQMILSQNPGLNPYNLRIGSTIKVCPGSDYLMPGCTESKNCPPIGAVPSGTVRPIRPAPPVTVRPIRPAPPVTERPIRPAPPVAERPIRPAPPVTVRPIKPAPPTGNGISEQASEPLEDTVNQTEEIPENMEENGAAELSGNMEIPWNPGIPESMRMPQNEGISQNMQSQPDWNRALQGMQMYSVKQNSRNQNTHRNPMNHNAVPQNNQVSQDILNERNGISAMDMPEALADRASLEMNEKYLDLNNTMRYGWIEYVYGIRMLILNIIEALADKEAVTGSLMESLDTIVGIYTDYYSEEVSKKVKELLTEIAKTAGELLRAYKDKNEEKIEELTSTWFDNADQLGEQLSSMNPEVELETVRRMLYVLLQLFRQTVEMRLAGDYNEEILAFDSVKQESMEMADYLVNALVKQFPERF